MQNKGEVVWKFSAAGPRRKIHNGCGGTVHFQRGRPACLHCGLVDNNGGWRNKVRMVNWHLISIDGWPGWDLVGDAQDKHPPFVQLTLCVGNTPSSTDIDREWDDISKGLFYSRDWTSDGTPFSAKGDTYTAGFWFEKSIDRERFLQRYFRFVSS